jgi:hypothetical protein
MHGRKRGSGDDEIVAPVRDRPVDDPGFPATIGCKHVSGGAIAGFVPYNVPYAPDGPWVRFSGNDSLDRSDDNAPYDEPHRGFTRVRVAGRAVSGNDTALDRG